VDVPTSTITIGVDPEFELGPLTLSWHGLMIAVGLLVGGWLARRAARERGLDPEALTACHPLYSASERSVVFSRLAKSEAVP